MIRRNRLILKDLKENIVNYYSDRLISLVVFGSFARGTATPESDVDLLLIVNGLHKRKMKRIEEFIDNVEEKIENVSNYISPIIKTPEEISSGSPILLDMVIDSIILYDKGNFFKRTIEKLRERLEELGSKRVFKGNRWYWILKPDLKFGEIIEL